MALESYPAPSRTRTTSLISQEDPRLKCARNDTPHIMSGQIVTGEDGSWVRLGVVATAKGAPGPGKGGKASRRDHEPSAATDTGTRWGEGPMGGRSQGIYTKPGTAQADGAGAWDPARTRRGAVAAARCSADREGREGGQALPPEAVLGHEHV